MSRLALRYYLPVVQIVLVLGLFGTWEIERYEAAHRPSQEIGWNLPSYERLDIFAESFGFLNAPALSTLLPLMWILPPEPEWPFVLSAILAILLFWFGVGRFFDRIRGLLPSQPLFRRSNMWRVFCSASLGLATMAMCAGVYLFFISHSEATILATPLLTWSSLTGLILFSEMRRPREIPELTFLTLER